MSAVALGVGLGSLAHRGWHPSSTAVGVPQLRQSYIKRHCTKWPPVSRRLLWWQPPLARPAGSCSTFYAKLPVADPGLSAVGAPRSVPALRAAACRPCRRAGAVAYVRRCARVCWSVASGQVSCVCPAHPVASPRFAGFGPRWSARPPPRGSLSPARGQGAWTGLMQALRACY